MVGLRGLLPFGLLAIENPFLEFDVGQSNEQGKKQTVRTSVCNTPSGKSRVEERRKRGVSEERRRGKREEFCVLANIF